MKENEGGSNIIMDSMKFFQDPNFNKEYSGEEFMVEVMPERVLIFTTQKLMQRFSSSHCDR